MKRYTRMGMMLLVAQTLVIAAGCGGTEPAAKTGDDAAAKPPEKLEPVTLKIQRPTGFAGVFEDTLQSELKKKYPTITAEFVDTPLAEMVAAGEVPDILVNSQAAVFTAKELDLAYDMNPLLKQFNIDVNTLKPEWVNMFKSDLDGKQAQLAIPIHTGVFALYYNKDIFDRFGVSYPKDGMTWDETIDLAKKLKRSDGGVDYYGIGFAGGPIAYLSTQLSLPLVDPKTGKSAINSEDWRKVVSLAKDLFDASGGNLTNFGGSATGAFGKTKNVAMLVATNEIRNMEEVNWDLVTMPVNKGGKNVGRGPTGIGMYITKTSPHKEDAMRLLTVYLSDEVQKAVANDGRPSILKKESMNQEFTKSSPRLEGKNVNAIFKLPPAPFAPASEYDSLVNKALNGVLNDILTGKKDLNTALREADEAANSSIEQAKK